jgi:CRP-like cAMP-binding protein
MEDFSLTREERLTTLLQENRERLVTLLERVFFLKNVEIFRHVDSDKLLLVAEIAQELKIRKGDTLIREGEIGDSLFMVAKGVLRLTQAREEKAYVVEHLKSGSVFGDLGIFGSSPHTVSAVCEEDCELLMLRKKDFKKLLMDNPEIIYNLLEIYAFRIRKLNMDITKLKADLGQHSPDKTNLLPFNNL